jgi:hypothetical protein
MTINLDSDLANIKTLAVAKEILDAYELSTEKVTDPYELLLKERFPIYYKLIQSIGDLDYTYEEFYYIADNGYKLKGVVESMEYLLSYINVRIKEITIVKHDLTFIIDSIATQDPAVTSIYIDKLKYDLLLFISGKTSINELIINYYVKGDFIISGISYSEMYEEVTQLLGGDV